MSEMKQPEKSLHQQSLEIPQSISRLGKLLQFFSSEWATSYAQKLFITPLKFKTPARETEMLTNSEQRSLFVPKIQKHIHLYRYGNGHKKALLIHGWNGRGTQLVTIANMLKSEGYTTISFDAPGHGQSPKSTTNMTEFIESAFELEKKYGPFDVAIGHSLGGMTTMNAIQRGLSATRAVIIGSGDIVQDIIDDFVIQLGLKPIVAQKMKERFEKRFNQSMQSYCVHKAAKEINIPILVIHDKDDIDVPVKAAHQIFSHLQKGEVMITEKLGHRKVLGDPSVIERIRNFITNA